MAKSSKVRTVSRSARTGKFVTKGYAKTHPSTTETEHRPAPRRAAKKRK